MSIIQIKDKAQWDDLPKSHQVVILHASAQWSGPSRLISPVFEKLGTTEKYDSDKVTSARVDIDDVPDISSQLGVRAIPTFYLFSNSYKQREITGANPSSLEALVRGGIDSS